MRILFVGDVVGSPGRRTLAALLPQLQEDLEPHFVVVNGENAAAGRGITEKIAKEFFALGVDVITSGNHIWDHRDIYPFLDAEPRLLRPWNYPPGTPGQGMVTVEKKGLRLTVLNLQGRVFMPIIDCPFRGADDALAEAPDDAPVFVDFHAEASSEKRVMAHYLDGRVAAFIGTHTHVPTADEEILPSGTAYLTDAGMTGPFDGSIGVTWESVLPRFLTAMPTRFDVAQQDLRLCAVTVDIDDELHVATHINRFTLRYVPE